jgi:hypothetical protein
MNRSTQRILVVAMLALVAQIAVADETGDVQRVCMMFDNMGAAVECNINVPESAVDLTTGDSVNDAAQFCQTMAAMVTPLVQTLSSSWKMRVFTPKGGDTPAAVCDLN